MKERNGTEWIGRNERKERKYGRNKRRKEVTKEGRKGKRKEGKKAKRRRGEGQTVALTSSNATTSV